MTSTREAPHAHDWADFRPTRRLGDSQWHTWGVGLLRSAGFPASGVALLGGPTAAAAADRGDPGAFAAAYRADSEAESRRLADLARDERVRTAIAWQNRTVYRILDALAAGTGKESKRRQRERTLAMYWLRYCAKAETIGFFGPAAWLSVGRVPEALTVDHGERLTVESRTFFERWALAALADWMVAQPGARWWFPPLPRPDVHLDGDRLLLPGGRVTRLRPEDRQILGYADGERNGAAITDALVHEDGWAADGARARVEKVLTRLLKQRLLTWDANIPVDVRAERILRRRVAAVADPELFARFETVLAELDRHRDAIDAAAAVSADELALRLDALDAFFVRTTGLDASRDEGKAYAGRTLCYQDAVRDCRVELGTDLLDTVARPLALVADAADWFGNRVVELVEAEVAALVRATAARRSAVTLADVWPRVLGLFWGDGAVPVHTATRELAERWGEVLDPAGAARVGPRGDPRVDLRVEDIEERASAAFRTGPVRSPHLALHSPDLQLLQGTDGGLTVVLGELHACLATCDLPFLDWTGDRTGDRTGGRTADGGSLRDKVNAAIDAPRLVPLLPVDWKRNSGRMVPAPIGAGDRLIGFARAPFDDRSRIDAAVAITLAERNGTVTATTPDGRVWSMAELLAVPVSIIAADAFKIGLDRAHAPRVTLGGLVLFRETWRVRAGEIPLAAKPDRERDYLAVRRWLRDSGLPDRAFVKFPQETKPSLVDFTSPTLMLSFANLVRRTQRRDADATVILSEPLPHPEDSWLTDADGERYVSELRLQISRKVRE
ncbi:lantibiotic dehydratase [Streptomyces apocyni]|uniref:lantibiotic dehydratase n=1 Tax=Streptomyces apocyni TaxID=2654677 RepID=UPI0012E9AFF7|nr:lantibiotic dehydratase [Streptomyces apocyni]